MYDQAAHRDHDPSAEFQQSFAQRPDLSASAVRATSAQTQFLHQYVSGGGQQHPQLVGPEVTAAGAVDLQIVQLFNSVLDLAPLPYVEVWPQQEEERSHRRAHHFRFGKQHRQVHARCKEVRADSHMCTPEDRTSTDRLKAGSRSGNLNRSTR
jgi:hypothetical protein